MKISEMNGDQLATCLCIIMEPAERILDDESIISVVENNITMREIDGKMCKYLDIPRTAIRLIPVLLTKHKRDTFTILGAMNGKTADEIASQNGLKTISDIKAIFDADMINFFMSLSSAV